MMRGALQKLHDAGHVTQGVQQGGAYRGAYKEDCMTHNVGQTAHNAGRTT